MSDVLKYLDLSKEIAETVNYVSPSSYLTPRYHGGGCCGVVTITGFSCQPSSVLPEYRPKTETKGNWARRTINGYETRSHTCCLDVEMPQQRASERLKAIVAYYSQKKALIECVLIVRGFVLQEKNWEKELLDAGFTRMEEWTNSNSGHRLVRYSLITEKKG